jgi:hypothetical protein
MMSDQDRWRDAVTATDLDLDERAIGHARSTAVTALAGLAFAAGAAETPSVRSAIEMARQAIAEILHDHIEPALGAVERRRADADCVTQSRRLARDCAWHARRLL